MKEGLFLFIHKMKRMKNKKKEKKKRLNKKMKNGVKKDEYFIFKADFSKNLQKISLRFYSFLKNN